MELHQEHRIDFINLEDCEDKLADELEILLHEVKFRKQHVSTQSLPVSHAHPMGVATTGLPSAPINPFLPPNLPPVQPYQPMNTVYIHNMTANVNYGGGVATSIPSSNSTQYLLTTNNHLATSQVPQDGHQPSTAPPLHPIPPYIQPQAALNHPAAIASHNPHVHVSHIPNYQQPYFLPPFFYPGIQNNAVPGPPPHTSGLVMNSVSSAPVPLSTIPEFVPSAIISQASLSIPISSNDQQVSPIDSNDSNAVEENCEPEKGFDERKEEIEMLEDNAKVDYVETNTGIEEYEEPAATLEVVEQNGIDEEIITESAEEIVGQEKKDAEVESVDVKPKSWASLFHNNSGGDPVFEDVSNNKPMAKISPFVNETSECKGNATDKFPKGATSNVQDGDVTKYLKDYTLTHKPLSIKPRGLSNRSNWCFVNSIIQAMISCPPFFNFIRSIPLGQLDSAIPHPMPITRSVWKFVQGIEVMTHFPKLNRRGKNKKTEDLPLGHTVEATSIFSMLLESKSFEVIEGRQEDAEELLTYLLNGINDEILAVLKLNTKTANQGGPDNGQDSMDDSDDWKEVGPKNKSCTTRRQICLQTPMADMFQGQIRSCIQRSSGPPTATLQPFFTLPLDIQSDKVKNVNDALRCNFDTEKLDDYVCTTTKKEMEASKSVSLEELPPIFILQLKRFVYNETGCQKLLKNIDFPVDLEIVREVLSSNSRNKFHPKQRQYKLFAVVYHNGTEAIKGHYFADVYHTGMASWLRCDDSLVKAVSESTVLAHSSNSVPYILFYRRGDTMMGVKDIKV